MKLLPTFLFLMLVAGMTLSAQVPEYGKAVFYADYLHGNKTAMGEIYDKYEFTCAHKTHPKGTLLKVTRLDNEKSVVVRVNDRGPYSQGCIIDLSWAAADKIGLIQDGIAQVKVEVTGKSDYNPTLTGANNATTKKGAAPKEYAAVSAFPGLSEYKPSTPPASPTVIDEDNVDVNWLPATQQGYGIQVASYTNLSNAKRRVGEIKRQGPNNVYIRQSKASDGSDLYRVVIGVYNERSTAQDEAQRLQYQFQIRGLVIDLSY